MSDQLKAQIARVLASLMLDRNDAAARLKIKMQLESDIPGSAVFMDPIDPARPTIIRGGLVSTDAVKPIHFETVAPCAELCLVCGEALEHVRVYGCVAGIHNCVYETLH